MASLSLTSMQRKRKPWSFHTMMLASGPSDLESKSKAEIVQLISSQPQLTAWTRNCSYRVVKKSEIEEIATKKKLTGNSYNKHANTNEEAQYSPIQLAEAFQDLVAKEKNEYIEYQNAPDHITVQESPVPAAALPPKSTTANTGNSKSAKEPVSSPASPQPEFEESAESEAPARIYLLVDYPSNINEVLVLLRTGEKGNKSKSGNVPLLPLIDGVLLLVDPTREQLERRKSFSGNTPPVGGEISGRRKSITTTKMDEKDFGMERADPSANNTVYQTANPVIKEFYDAAQYGGLEWSDFIFTDLHCSLVLSKEAKGIIDLTRELLKTTEKIAADKFAFKEWVSSIRMIPIPSIQEGLTLEQEEQVLTTYTSMIDTVHDKSIHVSTVLYAMKEAVAIMKSNPKEIAKLQQQLRTNSNQEEALDHFVDFRNIATYRVAKSFAYYHSLPIEMRPHCNTKSSTTIAGKPIDEIEREMWALSDLPGVGNQGRKGMPMRASISSFQRKVYDTEFAAFCAYPLEKVHLTRQLIQCEDFLGTPWKGKLRKRDMVEKLDKELLPQRLASVLADFPSIFKEYYAPTDALLLAIYTPTAPGRFKTLSWSAKDHVRHRTSFKDWRREKTLPDEYLTPRTAKASGACVPLSSAELSAISEKISVLFPADHSVIRIYQTPRHYNWLSIYHQGNLLGMRPQISQASPKALASHFSASFKDESRIHISEGVEMPHKPDGLGTVIVANTFNHGLIITSSSDGTILQQYALEDQIRAVFGKGCVLVSHRNGYKYILYPNGDVYEKHSVEGSFTYSSKFIKQEEGEVEVSVDPHTNALVEKRSNGVIIVTKSDGARVTYHTDGTRMYTTTSKSHVVVTQPHFADVAIDIDVNLTAKRHAAGEKVAVTKGGLRTRSCIDVSDGTRIEITYDTKVIAKVNGFVRTRKPNGALIIAKDSGEVEYYPSSVLQEHKEKQQQVVAMPGEDASSTLPTNGVYYFDCRIGNFQLCDQEQNYFFAEIGDGRGIPRISVELAGVISPTELEKYGVDTVPAKAVVNDPMEPYLFILYGDGTGREILRPIDFKQFVNELDPFGSEEKAIEIPSQIVPGMIEAKTKQEYETSHTFTKRFQGFGKKIPIFEDEKLDAEIEKLLVPVPSAARVLGDYPAAPFMLPSFTLIRQLQEIPPFNDLELNAISESLASWKNWMKTREENKEQYNVIDPRDAEMLAQEAVLQKKVLAVYKAARAKKKKERQKEKERLKVLQEGTKEHMETVQEVDEPQDEDSDGELDAYESNESDQESRDEGDVPVDDMDELLWTAFSQADTENTGKLSVAQSRKALVHALGFGVTQVEIINSLKKFNALEPYMVTFDAFTEVAAYLKAQEESKDNEDDSIGISRSQYIAAGSAADAVRSYNLRIKSGSSKNVSENASVNSSRPVEPSSPFINTN